MINVKSGRRSHVVRVTCYASMERPGGHWGSVPGKLPPILETVQSAPKNWRERTLIKVPGRKASPASNETHDVLEPTGGRKKRPLLRRQAGRPVGGGSRLEGDIYHLQKAVWGWP